MFNDALGRLIDGFVPNLEIEDGAIEEQCDNLTLQNHDKHWLAALPAQKRDLQSDYDY
jgi:hypothetical protein